MLCNNDHSAVLKLSNIVCDFHFHNLVGMTPFQCVCINPFFHCIFSDEFSSLYRTTISTSFLFHSCVYTVLL